MDDDIVDDILAERQRWVEYEQNQARLGCQVAFLLGVGVGLMIAIAIAIIMVGYGV